MSGSGPKSAASAGTLRSRLVANHLQGNIAGSTQRLCRALYTLATGKQTSKEAAVAWAAEQYPEWAAFVREGLAWYRADVTEAHRAVIEFADFAVKQSDPRRPPKH